MHVEKGKIAIYEKKWSEKNETSPRKFPSYAEIEAEKMKSN